MVAAIAFAIGTGNVLAEKRFFTVAAVEPKGGVTADREPFPSEPLPAGGGYVLNKPDANDRWEVSTYLWTPGQIIVNEGDEVTLEFIGINGASHPATIRGLRQDLCPEARNRDAGQLRCRQGRNLSDRMPHAPAVDDRRDYRAAKEVAAQNDAQAGFTTRPTEP